MSKKDKLLESAQKFIAKGQFDRAVKEYEQLLAMEPSNLGIRQRIADLLIRDNRKDQAIEEYTTVAKSYANNAHYLKAIAVYKQIQKLNPANPDIALCLGSLNEKQGLIGNAIAEYSSALNLYERGGESANVLKVLEAMLAIDSQNPQVLLKCCEAAFKAGKSDEAYEKFATLALTLRKRNDATGLKSVRERARTLFPARPDLLLNVARLQSEAGDASGGAATLREIIAGEPANEEAWLLLLEMLDQAGDRPPYLKACRECSAVLPSVPVPRERLIRAAIDAGAWGSACSQLTEHGPRLREMGSTDSLLSLAEALFAGLLSDPELLNGFAGAADACGLSGLAESARMRIGSEEEAAVGGAPLRPQAEPAASLPTAETARAAATETSPVETPETDWEMELDLSPLADEESTPAEPLTDQPAEWLEPTFGQEETAALPEEAGVEVQFELGDLPETPWEELPVEELPPGAEDDSESGFMADLAGELAAELDGMPFEPEGEGEEEQVSVFRRGVDEQLGLDDAESHYSLGIAFKEMGLLDEAIAEFRVASRAPERKVDSLVLQGLCYREKGDGERAMSLLMSGMGLQGLSRDELLTLKYELALLHEAGGKPDAALSLYREIAAVNRHFRETAQKLAALGEKSEKEGYVTLSLDELED